MMVLRFCVLLGLLCAWGARGDCSDAVMEVSSCAISADCSSLSCAWGDTLGGKAAFALNLRHVCSDAAPWPPVTFSFTLNDTTTSSSVRGPTTFVGTHLVALRNQPWLLKIAFSSLDKHDQDLFLDLSVCQNVSATCASEQVLLQGRVAQLMPTGICGVCYKPAFTVSPTLIIVHVLGFAVGCFLCVFGYRYFQISLFLCGSVFTGFATYYGCARGIPLSGELLHITCLAIAVAVGYSFGVFVNVFKRLAFLFVGAYSFPIFFVLVTLLSRALTWAHTRQAVFYVALALFSIVGAIVGMLSSKVLVQKSLFIFASALVGSCAIMAAIDYFLNGNLVLQALDYALTVTAVPPPLCWYSTLTLVSWPALAVASMIVQFRCVARYHDHRSHFFSTSKAQRQEYEMSQSVLHDYDSDSDDDLADYTKHRAMGHSAFGRSLAQGSSSAYTDDDDDVPMLTTPGDSLTRVPASAAGITAPSPYSSAINIHSRSTHPIQVPVIDESFDADAPEYWTGRR